MGADRIYSAHLSRGEGKRPTLSSPIWAHLSSGEGLTGGEGQPDLGSSLSVCIVAWVPAAMIDAFMLVVAPDEGAGRGALASRSYPGPDYLFNIIDEAAQVRRHSPLQPHSYPLITPSEPRAHSQ